MATKLRTLPPSAWFAVIPAIVLAGVLWQGFGFGMKNSTLFFVEARTGTLKAERRFVPQSSEVEARAASILEELALGPSDPALRRLFPEGTTISLVIKRDGILYVDIAIPDMSKLQYPFPLIVSSLDKSLSESAPGSGSLSLSVNGNPVIL